jgi:hypothetical protein
MECTTPRVNSNANYELGAIMMCLYGFTNCNNSAILVRDVDNREVICWGVRGIWEISLATCKFCSEPIKRKKQVKLKKEKIALVFPRDKHPRKCARSKRIA